MKFFKQLFCIHIYNEYRKVPLDTKTVTLANEHWCQTITVNTYGSYCRCIKCGKKKIRKVTVKTEIDRG